ncbi:MAG: GNAT family N-acetyltransferase [Lachnospiraceae bacterium]|nr:GNAT family N-acetyltransferase [Lachnospiraceae bacterium]
MDTPILETERLILRPIGLADAQIIFDNWTSDPDVARYMAYSTHESVETTRMWLREVEAARALDTHYDWGFVRRSDGMLIGSGGIYYKEQAHMFELGYNLMKACWHQGYTTEAAREMVRFAVEELGQTRLGCNHVTENVNSGKVMMKVGFRRVEKRPWVSLDGTKRGECYVYLYEKD